jgi:hypothetical protein
LKEPEKQKARDCGLRLSPCQDLIFFGCGGRI